MVKLGLKFSKDECTNLAVRKNLGLREIQKIQTDIIHFISKSKFDKRVLQATALFQTKRDI